MVRRRYSNSVDDLDGERDQPTERQPAGGRRGASPPTPEKGANQTLVPLLGPLAVDHDLPMVPD